MGERKDAAIARSYMSPCPSQSPSHAGPAAPAGPGRGAQRPGAFPAPNSAHRAPKGTGSSTGTPQGCTHGLYLAHARADVLRRLMGIIPSPACVNSLRQAVRAAGEGAALHSCRHSWWHRPWQPAEAVPNHGSSLSTLRESGQDGPKRLSSAVCAHCHGKLQAHTKRGLSSTAKLCQISTPPFFFLFFPFKN